MTTGQSITFAGETFEKYRKDVWESYTKIFVTRQTKDGLWQATSSPMLEFEGITSDVDGYTTEEDALRAAIIRYYEIQVKVCESELHKYKKILFEARGH